MTPERVYVFGDESGNLDFQEGKLGATRYYILTTVTLGDCSAGDALLALRRQLCWEDLGIATEIHATEDQQQIRDRIFGLLRQCQMRIDASVFTKANIREHIRNDHEYFVKLTWHLHLKHLIPSVAIPGGELMVTAAAVANEKKRRTGLYHAVQDAVARVAPTTNFRTAYWQAASDPCLQIADYCSWAIQRKWERHDARSYDLIKDKVHSEFQFFKG